MLQSLVVCNAPAFSNQKFRSIKKPDAEVEIRGKGQPEKIGKLELRSGQIDFAEGEEHPQDKNPEQYQPKEREPDGVQPEKEDAPKEVDS